MYATYSSSTQYYCTQCMEVWIAGVDLEQKKLKSNALVTQLGELALGTDIGRQMGLSSFKKELDHPSLPSARNHNVTATAILFHN